MITIIGEDAEFITFTYTNWKGKKAQRKALMKSLYWGSNEWHPQEQWLVRGFDLDKQAMRTYALKDMSKLQFCEEQ